MSTEIDFETVDGPPLLRDRMVAWLDEQYEPATAPQIAEALGAHPTTIERYLMTAQANGRVVCVGMEPSDSRRRYGARLWVSL